MLPTYHYSLMSIPITLQYITVLWFFVGCPTLYRYISGYNYTCFLSWAMFAAWWIGGGSGNILYDAKFKMILSDSNLTIGNYCCIFNHKRIFKNNYVGL